MQCQQRVSGALAYMYFCHFLVALLAQCCYCNSHSARLAYITSLLHLVAQPVSRVDMRCCIYTSATAACTAGVRHQDCVQYLRPETLTGQESTKQDVLRSALSWSINVQVHQPAVTCSTNSNGPKALSQLTNKTLIRQRSCLGLP